MSKKNILWLYHELPGLVEKGILTPQQTEQLRLYYGDIQGRSGRGIAFIVCSILGMFLIGSGIILLLAHNWHELTRTARAVISMTPLIIAQALAGYTIVKKNRSIAWCEGSATFLILSVGISISLISQTYHILTEFDVFILTWMLLSMPLIYFLDSTMAAILYISGITLWAGCPGLTSWNRIMFWPLVLPVIPHLAQSVKNNRYSIRSTLLGWLIAIYLCFGLGFTTSKVLSHGFWLIIYGSLFANMYLYAGLKDDPDAAVWRRPFHLMGSVGIVLLSFFASSKTFWLELANVYNRLYIHLFDYLYIPCWIVAGVIIVTTPCLLAYCINKKRFDKLFYGSIPLLMLLSYFISKTGMGFFLPLIIFNLLIFSLGIESIHYGIKHNQLRRVNSGMFILSVLIIARFFDNKIGFVVRGVAFILIGIGFLTTNMILLRRRGGKTK